MNMVNVNSFFILSIVCISMFIPLDVLAESHAPLQITSLVGTSTYSTIDLRWEKPGLNGGGEIVSYKIKYVTKNQTDEHTETVNAPATSYTLTDLESKKKYTITISSLNTENTRSPDSSSIAVITKPNPALLPSPPVLENVTRSNIRDSIINLSWSNPPDNDQKKILSYTIEKSVSPFSIWVEEPWVWPTTTSTPITNRDVDHDYKYRVKAFNSEGHSQASNSLLLSAVTQASIHNASRVDSDHIVTLDLHTTPSEIIIDNSNFQLNSNQRDASIFVIFCLFLLFSMILFFRLKDESVGGLFGIMSFILLIIIALMIISPYEYGFSSVKYHESVFNSTEITKEKTITFSIILDDNEKTLRQALGWILFIFAIFTGFYSIYKLINQNTKK